MIDLPGVSSSGKAFQVYGKLYFVMYIEVR